LLGLVFDWSNVSFDYVEEDPKPLFSVGDSVDTGGKVGSWHQRGIVEEIKRVGKWGFKHNIVVVRFDNGLKGTYGEHCLVKIKDLCSYCKECSKFCYFAKGGLKK